MKRFSLVFIFLLFFVSTVFAGSQQNSSLTAQTIINRVKYNINAVNDSLFATADMLDWINQGILDIITRSHCTQSSFEKALVADTYEYDISGDFNYLEITAVVYKDVNGVWLGLVETTPENLALGMANFPKFWYDDNVGSKVIIFPTMADVTGSPKIIIFYIPQPTAITAGNINITSIPLPSKYDQSLIYYVTFKALERDKRESSNMYNRYLESIKNAKGEKIK